jgi:hypothetical protein
LDRKLWILKPEAEGDLQILFPRLWARLQSDAVLLLILLLVVCTYAACPLTVSWAKIVGYDKKDGRPVKGRPFKESSLIVVSWGLMAVVGLALSAVLGGRRALRQCFKWRAIILFAPAGLGWALADVCEVLAVARIDPATYGVISQARLLSSAAACWLIRGMGQTRLQWGILAALSLVCMAYCAVPDGSVPNQARLLRWRLMNTELSINVEKLSILSPAAPDQMTPVTLALAKVLLSVLCGVYGEACFKYAGCLSDKPLELYVQMTQISFSGALGAIMGYFAICNLQNESPREFFRGPDGDWGRRTMVVAIMYCWREWICNICVKRFDSLVKNICNALALIVTYAFTVAVSCEKPFSLLKVLLLLAVVGEVINYSQTRRGTMSPSRADTSSHKRKHRDIELPVDEYRCLSMGINSSSSTALASRPQSNEVDLSGFKGV